MRSVTEPERQIPILGEVDVVVAGGGPAGVAAAIAAARNGASTFLVESYGFFGGMMTAGMVLTLGGFNSWLEPHERIVGGIAGEMLARAAALGGAEDNEGWVLNSDPEILKLVLDKLVEEAGVDYLLHTVAVAPVQAGEQVQGILVENKSGRGAILGSVVIDATGDGDIATRAGASYSKASTPQPMTLCFRLGDVHGDDTVDIAAAPRIPLDQPGYLEGDLLEAFASRRSDVSVDQREMRQLAAEGRLPLFGGPWFGGLHRQELWVNSSRIHGDPTDARSLTRAEVQGRRDIHSLIAYFRQRGKGFAQSRLVSSGPQIGLRESRRLVGAHVLTGDEIRSGVTFPDAIAKGCWPVDVHPSDASVGVHRMYIPRPYGIPYRCLIPSQVEGLLVAGRCISTDREACGSMRVAATCMALGQAAGTAAALAAKRSVAPSQVDTRILRERLVAQGALL